MALAAFAFALFAPSLLNDGDPYWHLAAGEWIIWHRAVPAADPFSYTAAGQPWHAHEWLAELLMAAAFRAGEMGGLLVLCAAAFAFAIGIVAAEATRALPAKAALATVLVAAACVGPSLLARPHLLALPLLAWWTRRLFRARAAGRAPWDLPVPMLVWANLHGSFVFGLALLAGFALERAVVARGLAWAGVLAAAMLAACATPWGAAGLLFPFRLMSMAQLGMITEWQPPDFSKLQPIEVALLLVLAVACTKRLRLSALRLAVLLALVHLALQHGRHQMLAGIVGALTLAAPLGRAWGRVPAPAPAGPRLAASLLAAAVALAALRIATPWPTGWIGDGRASPVEAVAHAPANPGHVLNDYDFGGYLIWRGIPPFIDGRADLYGDAFLQDYDAIVRPDRAALLRALERWDVGWTLFRAGSAVTAEMDALPGWRRAYADRIAVVHVRDGSAR